MRRAPLLVLLVVSVAALGWLLLGSNEPVQPPNLEGIGDGTDTDGTTLREADAAWPAAGVTTDGNDADAVAGAAERTALTGEVLDERGRGIDRARVTVVSVDPATLRGSPIADGAPLAATETDRQGDFELDEVPQGRWLRVLATREGYATVGRLVPSAGAHVVLVLPAAAGLALTVVDTDEQPVEGAAVHASASETRLERTTDAAGRVRFEALPPGATSLRVLTPDRGSARAGPFILRAGTTHEQLIVVARGIAIEGTVVDDASGQPITDARVRVATPGRAHEATTDDAGRFGPISAGGAGSRVFLAVEAKGHAPLLQPVMLPAEGTQSVELRLQPGTPWRGRVVDARGAPVAGASVRYSADGIALPMRGGSTTTDAEGTFVLPPPPPPAPGRRVVLIARAGAALGALALRPDQAPPTPLEIELQRGTQVSGRVVDGAGAPMGGVTVRLGPSWQDIERGPIPTAAESRLHAFNAVGNQGLAAATGADGRWTIEGVPTGPYRAWVRQGAHERMGMDILEIEGERSDVGDIVLDDALTLTGDVLDERGVGVAGAEVLVTTGEGTYDRRRTRTDSDGTFRVPWLVAGSLGIRVSLAGRSVSTVATIEPETSNHVRIDLPESARLRLEVFQGEGPYAGLLTVVFGEIGSGRAASRRYTTRARAGVVVLDDVPVGDWTLEAFGPKGLRGQAQEVVTEGGRETAARLTLAVGARLHGTVRTEGGAPVPGAVLDLSQPATGGRVQTTADAAGRFRFEGLAPGNHVLAVRGRGGAPLREALVLSPGENRPIDPTLPAGGRVEVIVIDADGRPVSNALVAFQLRGGGRIRTTRAPRTDARGIVVQDSLPLGAVLVTARDARGRRGVAEAFVGADRTEAVEVRVQAR